MQKITTLSVIEAELIAATTMAQDIIFKAPFEVHQLEVENKGTVDLIKNYSVIVELVAWRQDNTIWGSAGVKIDVT